MSLVSQPSVASEATIESKLVASQIRRYELESSRPINTIFGQSQLFERLFYSQFQFGFSSQTNNVTNNAIQCSATVQVRRSIASSIENEAVSSDVERNFSFSDFSSTKLLIGKTDKRKAIVVGILGFISVLLSCIIPAIFLLPRAGNDVCNTQTCLLESAKKIAKMDQQVEP